MLHDILQDPWATRGFFIGLAAIALAVAALLYEVLWLARPIAEEHVHDWAGASGPCRVCGEVWHE